MASTPAPTAHLRTRPVPADLQRAVAHPPAVAPRLPHILVVDADPAFQKHIVRELSRAGYGVAAASSGAAALTAAYDTCPNLVLLDLQLPDIDGASVCRTLWQQLRVPIIVLSSDGSEVRKVTLLDSGATDYITKPLALAEFHARVRAALRNTEPPRAHMPEEEIVVDDLLIDLARRRAVLSGRPLSLTPTEWNLLCILITAPERVHTYDQLTYQLWADEPHRHIGVLHTFVAQLRRKLGVPTLIANERGVGYVFRLRDSLDQAVWSTHMQRRSPELAVEDSAAC